MTQYTEKYKCNLCGTVWRHMWDTDDYNNDYTQCPECLEFDFKDITEDQMKALLIKQCSDPQFWYSDKVGQTVPLLQMPVNGEYLSREPAGYTNIVKEQDAVVVELSDLK